MSAASREPCRILIVDGHAETARALESLCRSSGHETRVARTAPEAMSAFGAFSPDLILVDVNLPGKSGFEFARQIRSNSTRARTVLVAVADRSSDEQRTEAYRVGFNEYIARPVNSERVHSLVNELCALAA